MSDETVQAPRFTSVELGVLSKDMVETARHWRNGVRPGLRTPYLLTKEMQEDFYHDVVCKRESPHRYWAVFAGAHLYVGMGGLTNIQWENGLAEISLILSPESMGHGIGRLAALAILAEGFESMRLATIFGEVYHCNPGATGFWKKLVEEVGGTSAVLPRRKFWNGAFYDATLFSFFDEAFRTWRAFQELALAGPGEAPAE